MKYRYIYEQYGEIYGTNQIAREHLVAVKERRSDFLVDVLEGKYFDAENNEWADIKA